MRRGERHVCCTASCHQILTLKGCPSADCPRWASFLARVFTHPPGLAPPLPQGHEAGALHAYALPNLSTQQQPGTALGNALDLRSVQPPLWCT